MAGSASPESLREERPSIVSILGDRQPESTSLPVPRTSFVGRERELDLVAALLARDDVRLVTLTGPGGVGKTRLAMQVAGNLAPAFPDGVVFVPLAAVRDPALVIPAIAQELGVRATGGRSLIAHLKAFLASHSILLVLDNFEQVVEAALGVADLVTAAPSLTVLVTSRERLRLSIEHAYPVPPLTLPAAGEPATLERVAETAAVRLFVERAQTVQPDFVLTGVNVRAVSAICQRLDGLPLAVELAATRVRFLPPGALLARLSQRLPLLTGGPRDRPARQQTMRGAIAWSEGLLSPWEQRLFRTLAIFVDGFTLSAAEALVSDPGAVLLDGIISLAEKGLLQPLPGSADEPRFGMLETIREYGNERLAATGEAETVGAARNAYFLNLALSAHEHIEGPGRTSAHDMIQVERENLRSTIESAIDNGDAETAQKLANTLARFWINLGYLTEGRALLERSIAMPGHASPPTLVEALYWAGTIASHQHDPVRTAVLGTESLNLARACGYRRGEALALILLGNAVDADDFDHAAALTHQCLAIFQELGDPVWEAMALRRLGEIAGRSGDPDGAAVWHEAAITIWRRLDHPWGIPDALRTLADNALTRGDVETAMIRYQESLMRWRDLRERLNMSGCFAGLARVAQVMGQNEPAARLFGVIDALDTEMGYAPPRDLHAAIATARNATRTAMGVTAFDAAWKAGGALSLEQAVAEALALPPPMDEPVPAVSGTGAVTPGIDASQPGTALTRRERDVLRMMASGRTNQEIANALFVSVGTIKVHVTHIFAKLGVKSRAAATDYAHRHDLA